MAKRAPPETSGSAGEAPLRGEAARLLFDHIDDGVLLLDAGGRILATNAAFHRLLGHAPEAVLGRTLEALGVSPGPAEAEGEGEVRYRDVRGMGIPVWEQRTRVGDGSGRRLVRFTLLDAQAALLRLANRDYLTGLPNRALFLERLNHALARMERSRERLAVLFIDLDHFKHINDAFGHATGDAFLKAVAHALSCQVRDGDTLARYGGDEFCLLLEGVPLPGDAARVAQKILEVLTQPIEADDYSLTVGASIGIAVATGTPVDAERLIGQADQAMYRAKRAGGHGYRVWSEHADWPETMPHEAGEGGLSTSFDEVFEIRFRPFAWIGERERLAMVEAEVGLRHGGGTDRECLTDFLRQHALLEPVEAWLVEQAIAYRDQWHQQGLTVPLLAIRLSGSHLFCISQQGLIERLVEAGELWERGILIELPLDLLGDNPALVAPCLSRLQRQGLQIGVEGFGAQATSLASLERFVPDMVKLDPGLVDRFVEQPVSAALLRAICHIGEELGIRVAVNAVQALPALSRAGCHWAPAARAGVDSISARQLEARLPH